MLLVSFLSYSTDSSYLTNFYMFQSLINQTSPKKTQTHFSQTNLWWNGRKMYIHNKDPFKFFHNPIGNSFTTGLRFRSTTAIGKFVDLFPYPVCLFQCVCCRHQHTHCRKSGIYPKNSTPTRVFPSSRTIHHNATRPYNVLSVIPTLYATRPIPVGLYKPLYFSLIFPFLQYMSDCK